ncbi:MAG: PaaX family transcriptional regulator C-terminal domain-containing protein [Paracoccaceae bacterium]
MPRTALIEELMQGLPLTAASFIVTVYGDVVVPRGEVLWMGSLIEICDRVGISENLVRTATSRLVSSGRLEGERAGRRSFYRLAPEARAEFAEAARLLYTQEVEPARWFVLYAPSLAEDEARRHRMARMGGDVWLCPDRGEAMPPAALILRAEAPADPSPMAAFWDLSALQARYQAMLDRFGPLLADLALGRRIGAEDALVARLLLVHVFRGVLLRDPCLPAAALPADWHGAEARLLFRQLYAALSPQADAQIGRLLKDGRGPLPVSTSQTDARLLALA